MLAMLCASTVLFHHQEGSVGGYPVRVDTFAMEITFVWYGIMCARSTRPADPPFTRPVCASSGAPPALCTPPPSIAAATVH